MQKRIKLKPKLSSQYRKQGLVLTGFSLVILLLLAFFFLLTPKISLKGKAVIEVNLNTDYKEPGFKASYLGKNITKKVHIKKDINTTKEGNYEIIYRVKEGPFQSQIKRLVKVGDFEKPVITLENGSQRYFCPGREYKEEGYHANDTIDGDLTKKVKVKKDKFKITYTVRDKKGNQAEAIRVLKEGDKEAPVLSLHGEEVMFVPLNSTFTDPSYEAVDNCDGDLTKQVKVSGEVNTSTVGENELTYTVTDHENNKTTMKRIVKVIIPGGPGTIYLTFDDGPKQGTTDAILDILKEEDVKATFFVTNNGPDELIKRAYDEGHTVGLHTASHRYEELYASVDAYFLDLQTVHDRVERITGFSSKIIRFPGGSSNTISRKYSPGIMSVLSKEVLKRGYQYYDWNLSSGDAGSIKTSGGIYQNVIANLSLDRVNMVLMHDIKPYTRDALRDIIRYGKANGYHFEAITMDTEMIRQKVNN